MSIIWLLASICASNTDKMRYLILIILLSLVSCIARNKILLHNSEYKLDTPPGTKKISENFFADISETSNENYKNYLNWLEKLYGSTSRLYQDALPDSLVFEKTSYEPQYGEPHLMGDYYFQHPGFNEYPVVGVNYDQAKKYCEWRTNTYAEEVFLKTGVIQKITFPDSTRHFTIRRYLDGSFDWLVDRKSVPYARFQIPNNSEWEQIAGIDSGFEYGIDTSILKKRHRQTVTLFHTRDGHSPSLHMPLPLQAPTISYPENVYGLYNLIGNVSELVRDSSIVKGGSYKDLVNDIGITGSEIFTEPNYWTGFRCICRYEMPILNGS